VMQNEFGILYHYMVQDLFDLILNNTLGGVRIFTLMI